MQVYIWKNARYWRSNKSLFWYTISCRSLLSSVRYRRLWYQAQSIITDHGYRTKCPPMPMSMSISMSSGLSLFWCPFASMSVPVSMSMSMFISWTWTCTVNDHVYVHVLLPLPFSICVDVHVHVWNLGETRFLENIFGQSRCMKGLRTSKSFVNKSHNRLARKNVLHFNYFSVTFRSIFRNGSLVFRDSVM